MSMKNLADVCSHISNASMARLGITSIIHTKLHLSIALLLQKQGFLSQVRLAGRSVPRSMQPGAVAEEQRPVIMGYRFGAQRIDKLPRVTSSQHASPTAKLNDAQLAFLVAHYEKNPTELAGILPDNSDQKWYVQLVQRHRRLVKEALNLVQERDGHANGLLVEVARVLQQKPGEESENDTAQVAEEEDPDQEGIVTQKNRASRRLWLEMKYYHSQPVLRKATMISTPKKLVNLGIRELQAISVGRNAGSVKGIRTAGEVIVVRTSEGVVDIREAVERHVGGIALFRVS